jgi:hypothetical protein
MRVAETAAPFFSKYNTDHARLFFCYSIFFFLFLGCLVVEVFVLGMEDELEAQLIFFWYTIVCGAGLSSWGCYGKAAED